MIKRSYDQLKNILERCGIIEPHNALDYFASWEEPDRSAGIDMEATKKRICELIKKKGLKDKTIAEKMGITPQAVNKWRHKGTFLVIENLYILSGLLGVSMDELIVPAAVKKNYCLIERH